MTGGRSGLPQPKGTREEPRQSGPARRRAAPAPATDATVRRRTRRAAPPRATSACLAAARTASAHREIRHAAFHLPRCASSADPGCKPTGGASRRRGDTRSVPRAESTQPSPRGRGGVTGGGRRCGISQGSGTRRKGSGIRSHLCPSQLPAIRRGALPGRAASRGGGNLATAAHAERSQTAAQHSEPSGAGGREAQEQRDQSPQPRRHRHRQSPSSPRRDAGMGRRLGAA